MKEMLELYQRFKTAIKKSFSEQLWTCLKQIKKNRDSKPRNIKKNLNGNFRAKNIITELKNSMDNIRSRMEETEKKV